MGVAIPALFIAGGALSAASSIYGGVSANNAARRQAARLEQDADVARQIGAQQAELALEDGRRAEGAAVAEAGGTGFGVDGTIFDGLASIRRASALDAANSRYEAQRRETQLRAEALEQRKAGTRSLITGIASGTGSLLGGVARAKLSGSQ